MCPESGVRAAPGKTGQLVLSSCGVAQPGPANQAGPGRRQQHIRPTSREEAGQGGRGGSGRRREELQARQRKEHQHTRKEGRSETPQEEGGSETSQQGGKRKRNTEYGEKKSEARLSPSSWATVAVCQKPPKQLRKHSGSQTACGKQSRSSQPSPSPYAGPPDLTDADTNHNQQPQCSNVGSLGPVLQHSTLICRLQRQRLT